jgi:4-nitrophenyl phosphatase
MIATPFERLRTAKGFVLDMDGTLVLADGAYNKARPLPGAVALVERLNRSGLPFAVMTNGTASSPDHLAAMLTAAGLPVTAQQVVTPTVVAARYLARRGAKTVMVLTPEAGCRPFEEEGIAVVNSRKACAADAVFVGWFRDFTMIDIENAAEAVLGGARLISASMNTAYMTERGRTFTTSRPIAAAISSLTGRRPILSGKPSDMALRAVTKILGVPASDIVVVGDDADLEVALARRGGALAALVRTGVSGEVATDVLPPDRRPDLHIDTIEDLLAAWAA